MWSSFEMEKHFKKNLVILQSYIHLSTHGLELCDLIDTVIWLEVWISLIKRVGHHQYETI